MGLIRALLDFILQWNKSDDPCLMVDSELLSDFSEEELEGVRVVGRAVFQIRPDNMLSYVDGYAGEVLGDVLRHRSPMTVAEANRLIGSRAELNISRASSTYVLV